MIQTLMRMVFGTKQDRDVKRLRPVVSEINEVFDKLQSVPDDELKDKTNEFRKLLGVSPRVSRCGEETVYHERAEDVLRTHPDVDRAAFTATRRDAHPSDLVAWVKLREGLAASDDIATQIRGGMGRLGPGYSPAHVFFVDELPRTEDHRGRTVTDYHLLTVATEQLELESWKEARWKDLREKIHPEEEKYGVMDLIPEAFAVMKEVCRRHLGKKWMVAEQEMEWIAVPFDVQLMGAVSLAEGNISEMATGEGKTLTAIMPLYLHALTCKGSHLVTVNDYLARRDSEWNEPLFRFLGMTVGCLDKTQPHTPERRAMYLSDVSYGTVNEFGFDYLRDNMARHRTQLSQREPYFCIVDEVDSVLIDEARTPLIISGPVDRSTEQYDRILPSIRDLAGKQNMVISRLAKDAEELLEKEDTTDDEAFEAGVKLLQCHKGLPKHKRYMKLRQEPSWARMQDRVEMELIREKRMPEIERDLYFIVDEKNRTIELTEKGRNELSPDNPNYFVLSDIVDEFARIEADDELNDEEKEEKKKEARAAHDKKAEELHTISQLLHAFVLKIRDVDYVVEENKVVIVDENTGRKMTGRRWSDGLHQAVEAKEGAKIESETQTLATITIQNYFRMYKVLSGMTGTAETEAAEFHATYQMDVVTIPTNKPMVRVDMDDVVFRTKREKYAAVLEEVERLHRMELPILVGTTNVMDSEKLSKMFSGRKLTHNVLNAKNHLKEAQIVADAGRPGAITIATNMAGRGTDIRLGESVAEPHKDPETGEEWPGGLQIVGTERHEARRIDRQLRGRSGRQGDPGTSRFFVSLEDNLMLWFGSDRISVWLERLGMKEGEAIENRMVTRSITKAQKKVEMINHERRQRTLKFDDVMNRQRLQVYGLRRDILLEEDLRPIFLGVFEDAIDSEFTTHYGEKGNMGDANIEGWLDWIETTIVTEPVDDIRGKSWGDYEELHEAAMAFIVRAYDEKITNLGDIALPFSRYIGLQMIDTDWQDHLLTIDELRESVGLRSYGQKDPLVEFTRDATAAYEDFMLRVNKNVFQTFFRAQPVTEEEARQRQRVQRMVTQKAQALSPAEAQAAAQQAAARGQQDRRPQKPRSQLGTYRRETPKVGRNDPCPCGSGRKFKDCHGHPSHKERVQHTVQGPPGEEEPR